MSQLINSPTSIEPMWITRDRRSIPVRRMNDAHLMNVIRKFGLENGMNPTSFDSEIAQALMMEAISRGLLSPQKTTSISLGDHVHKNSKKKSKPSQIREGSLLDHQLMKIGAFN